MLHNKLLKDWSEIPVQEYDTLKSKLLEAVVYFKDGPKVVLNRLCISVSAIRYLLSIFFMFFLLHETFIIMLCFSTVGRIRSSHYCSLLA